MAITRLVNRLSFWQKLLPLALVISLPITMYLPWTGLRWKSSKEIYDWLVTHFSEWPFGLVDLLANAALFCFVFLFLRWFIQWCRPRKNRIALSGNTCTAPHYLLDDVAISEDGIDELDRENFVITVTCTIVLPPNANSLVLAIEAPWGSGKTSFIGLLRRQLREHSEKPLVVTFSPWLATGQNRITRAFFSQFSAALMNAKEKELADKLLKFGEVLEDLLPAGARVFPRLGLQPIRRLTGHIPIVDLEGERTSLSRKVSEVGRSIVVIVDDIDRLPPRDIRVIFQIIKAVAAFPRITYLLAFDPGPVDRALCFGRSRKGGKEFRDKIVQVNFPLPRIGYGTRKRFFVSRLNERIEFWRFLLQPYEERLRDDAIPLVLSALLTPSRNSGTGLVLLDVSESLNLKGPKVKVRHR